MRGVLRGVRRLSQVSSGMPVSTVHGRKRFFQEVGVRNSAGGFEVTLDGRAIKTPLRNQLELPTMTLAQGIANEWDMQEKVIIPATMPLMELACTAIDTTGDRRVTSQMERELLSYIWAH